MFEPNVRKILERLTETDQVLDVGGWACPFNRANWILDAQPFETRGYYKSFGGPPSQGGDREYFTQDTWVQRDMCAREPWPFRDKQFDFAICSHTLEDIRDPLWVCSELMRVAKAGYIEVPSREWETCRGIERRNQAGLSHHRWLVEVRDNTHLIFTHKFHAIHTHWRFSFPADHSERLTDGLAYSWIWWNDSFSFEEAVGFPDLDHTLESYVQSRRPYPPWQLAADRGLRKAATFGVRAKNGIARRLRNLIG
jgi:hypothetical protein